MHIKKHREDVFLNVLLKGQPSFFQQLYLKYAQKPHLTHLFLEKLRIKAE